MDLGTRAGIESGELQSQKVSSARPGSVVPPRSETPDTRCLGRLVRAGGPEPRQLECSASKMSKLPADVEELLRKLSHLSRAQYSTRDPFLNPECLSLHCRIYDEDGELMIRVMNGTPGRVSDLFDRFDVSVIIENGFKLVRGINQQNVIRELAALADFYYTDDEWRVVQSEGLGSITAKLDLARSSDDA